MRILNTLLIGLIGIVLSYGSAIAQRDYTVNYNLGEIEIDGDISVDEWNAASSDGGDWDLLRTAQSPDANGNRFRALWDEEALYLLFESDDIGHPANNGVAGQSVDAYQQNIGIDFNADNLNIYIDSNSDGETGEPTDADGNAATDGYQIAFNIREGFSGFVEKQLFNTGLFIEAHVNSPFGNQGMWDQGVAEGYRQWEFASNADENGQLVEMRFPWETFDAPGIEDVDTSVFHPFAPEDGDSWIFNMSKINDNAANFLPIWNWKEGQSFAPWPHGRLTFSGPDVQSDPCDFDMDGDCDVADIDLLMYDGIANNDLAYDLDGSGTVDTGDRNAWLIEADSLPGDATLDGIVKSDDLNEVGVSWQRMDATSWSQGDFNGDGIVDSTDLNDVGVNWQSTAATFAGAQPASAVPEPTGALTGLLAVLGLLAMRRRRR